MSLSGCLTGLVAPIQLRQSWIQLSPNKRKKESQLIVPSTAPWMHLGQRAQRYWQSVKWCKDREKVTCLTKLKKAPGKKVICITHLFSPIVVFFSSIKGKKLCWRRQTESSSLLNNKKKINYKQKTILQCKDVWPWACHNQHHLFWVTVVSC